MAGTFYLVKSKNEKVHNKTKQQHEAERRRKAMNRA